MPRDVCEERITKACAHIRHARLGAATRTRSIVKARAVTHTHCIRDVCKLDPSVTHGNMCGVAEEREPLESRAPAEGQAPARRDAGGAA